MKAARTGWIFVLGLVLQAGFAQHLSVTFSKTDKACEAGHASVIVESGRAPFQYLWSNGGSDDQVANLEAGTYTLTVTDAFFRDTSIVFTIETFVCEPVPENYFSPNGDTQNDRWDISKIEYFPDFELFVYNRWGQQVHQQEKKYTPWDGTHLGNSLPAGSYYYVIILSKSDKNKSIKGHVTILR